MLLGSDFFTHTPTLLILRTLQRLHTFLVLFTVLSSATFRPLRSAVNHTSLLVTIFPLSFPSSSPLPAFHSQAFVSQAITPHKLRNRLLPIKNNITKKSIFSSSNFSLPRNENFETKVTKVLKNCNLLSTKSHISLKQSKLASSLRPLVSRPNHSTLRSVPKENKEKHNTASYQPLQQPNQHLFTKLLLLLLFGKKSKEREKSENLKHFINHRHFTTNFSLSSLLTIHNNFFNQSSTKNRRNILKYTPLSKRKQNSQYAANRSELLLEKSLRRPQRSDTKGFHRFKNSDSPPSKTSPCHILTIYRLKTADCSGRRLDVVPKRLGKDLKVLNLSTNFIRSFSSTDLENYKHIQEIILSNNEIEVISAFTFSHLKLLHALDLERNLLKEVPAGSFSHCPSLRVLSLKNNPLQWIDERAFEGLDKLEVLNLENCLLKKFDLMLLKDMRKLQELNIAGNLLTSFDESRKNFIPSSMTILRNAGNRWSCDCHLTWLRKFLEESNVNWDFPRNPPLCSSPEILYGLPWSQLQPHQFACPAVILTNLSSQSVLQAKEGDLVEVKCSFSGDPHPRLSWSASFDGKNFHRYTPNNNSTKDYHALLNQFSYEKLKGSLQPNALIFGFNEKNRKDTSESRRVKKNSNKIQKNYFSNENVEDQATDEKTQMNSHFSRPVLIESIFVKLDESEKRRDFKCVVENNAGRSEVTFKIMMIKKNIKSLWNSPEAIFGVVSGCVFVLVVLIMVARTLRGKCKKCSKNRNVARSEDQNGFVLKNALDLINETDEEKQKEESKTKHKVATVYSQANTQGGLLKFKLAKSNMKVASKALEQENYFVFTSLTRANNKLHHKSVASTSTFSSYFSSPSPLANTTIPNKHATATCKANSVEVNIKRKPDLKTMKLTDTSHSHISSQYYSTFPHQAIQHIPPTASSTASPPSLSSIHIPQIDYPFESSKPTNHNLHSTYDYKDIRQAKHHKSYSELPISLPPPPCLALSFVAMAGIPPSPSLFTTKSLAVSRNTSDSSKCMDGHFSSTCPRGEKGEKIEKLECLSTTKFNPAMQQNDFSHLQTPFFTNRANNLRGMKSTDTFEDEVAAGNEEGSGRAGNLIEDINKSIQASLCTYERRPSRKVKERKEIRNVIKCIDIGVNRRRSFEMAMNQDLNEKNRNNNNNKTFVGEANEGIYRDKNCTSEATSENSNTHSDGSKEMSKSDRNNSICENSGPPRNTINARIVDPDSRTHLKSIHKASVAYNV